MPRDIEYERPFMNPKGQGCFLWERNGEPKEDQALLLVQGR